MRCKLSYKGGTCVEVDSSGNENFISLADCTEDRTCRSLYPDHPFCNKETGACLQRCCNTFQMSQSVTKVSQHCVTFLFWIIIKYCVFQSRSRFHQHILRQAKGIASILHQHFGCFYGESIRKIVPKYYNWHKSCYLKFAIKVSV